MSHSLITLKLNENREYIFSQHKKEDLEVDFEKIASYGDKISKGPFSDKLYLTHNDTIHVIHIGIPED